MVPWLYPVGTLVFGLVGAGFLFWCSLIGQLKDRWRAVMIAGGFMIGWSIPDLFRYFL